MMIDNKFLADSIGHLAKDVEEVYEWLSCLKMPQRRRMDKRK